MNWIEEARHALIGVNVDSTELSEAVVVKLGPVWLWLHRERTMTLECQGRGLITRSMCNIVELLEDRLSARGWRRA